MASIAVFGDAQSVQCFTSVGFAVFPAPDDTEACSRLFRDIVHRGYEIIFITERLSMTLSAQIEKYKSVPVPAIIPIPSAEGNLGTGMAAISRNVEKAVGKDII